jgi:hypothetical protein
MTAGLLVAGTALMLFPRPDGLPAAWVGPFSPGLDPDDAQPLLAAVRSCSLLPEHGTGWFGRPGLAGHRLDADADEAGVVAGRDWSPVFRPLRSSGESRRALVEAEDQTAGLGLVTEVEAVPGGAVRVRQTLTNLGRQPYVVDSLEVVFPLPARVGEVLDFTGRPNAERLPQRHRIGDGLWLREGRAGRLAGGQGRLARRAAPARPARARSRHAVRAVDRTGDGQPGLRPVPRAPGLDPGRRPPPAAAAAAPAGPRPDPARGHRLSVRADQHPAVGVRDRLRQVGLQPRHHRRRERRPGGRARRTRPGGSGLRAPGPAAGAPSRGGVGVLRVRRRPDRPGHPGASAAGLDLGYDRRAGQAADSALDRPAGAAGVPRRARVRAVLPPDWPVHADVAAGGDGAVRALRHRGGPHPGQQRGPDRACRLGPAVQAAPDAHSQRADGPDRHPGRHGVDVRGGRGGSVRGADELRAAGRAAQRPARRAAGAGPGPAAAVPAHRRDPRPAGGAPQRPGRGGRAGLGGLRRGAGRDRPGHPAAAYADRGGGAHRGVTPTRCPSAGWARAAPGARGRRARRPGRARPAAPGPRRPWQSARAGSTSPGPA